MNYTFPPWAAVLSENFLLFKLVTNESHLISDYSLKIDVKESLTFCETKFRTSK